MYINIANSGSKREKNQKVILIVFKPELNLNS